MTMFVMGSHSAKRMGTNARATLWCVLVSLLGLVAPQLAEASSVHRYALVIGHNQGDSKVKPLKFAQRDATRIGKLLYEMGGFQKQNVVRLLAPTLQQVRAAIAGLKAKMKANVKGSGKKGMFLFYYSGHSRASHFLLAREKFAYREVMQFVRGLSVRIRLMIVDSCYSGRMTTVKGDGVQAKGASRKGFIRWSHRQLPSRVKGYAILASSGAGERSYESQRLRSSFFTASLIAGLRGAADRNHDHNVSLAEAYQYARRQTINFSGMHHVGLQTPVFLFKLQGDGPLILTQVRRAEAHLALAPSLHGYCLLYRKGHLVHEFRKPKGQRVMVGVKQGTYQVQLRRGRWIGVHNTTLGAQKLLEVRDQDLKWHLLKPSDPKGSWLQKNEYLRVGFLGHYSPVSQLALHGVGLSALLDLTRWMRLGVRYQLSLANPEGHPYRTHGIGLSIGLGYAWDFHRLRLWAGTLIEPRLSIRTHLQTQDSFTNFGVIMTAAGQLDWALSPRWSLRVTLAGGAHLIFFNQAVKIAPAIDAAFGIVWHL